MDNPAYKIQPSACLSCGSSYPSLPGYLGGVICRDDWHLQQDPQRLSYEVQFGTQLQQSLRFRTFDLAMAFAEGWKAGRKSAGFSYDFRIVNLDRVDENSPGLSEEEKERVEEL